MYKYNISIDGIFLSFSQRLEKCQPAILFWQSESPEYYRRTGLIQRGEINGKFRMLDIPGELCS